mmetsp:Transcript_29748/g.65839  ORF Transcript_29748/g.65839 Transcript_29748/m.65839 type:complete len:94 (+) Transcript_29748:27-308(+)
MAVAYGSGLYASGTASATVGYNPGAGAARRFSQVQYSPPRGSTYQAVRAQQGAGSEWRRGGQVPQPPPLPAVLFDVPHLQLVELAEGFAVDEF